MYIYTIKCIHVHPTCLRTPEETMNAWTQPTGENGNELNIESGKSLDQHPLVTPGMNPAKKTPWAEDHCHQQPSPARRPRSKSVGFTIQRLLSATLSLASHWLNKSYTSPYKWASKPTVCLAMRRCLCGKSFSQVNPSTPSPKAPSP